jgi:hypothetical protein
MSQFLHGLQTHQKCHPLSMFGMLWIDEYNSMFQFPFQQLCTAIEEEWGSIPQATINSLLNSIRRQMAVTPGTDWLYDPHPYFFFKDLCGQHMYICIPSHVKHMDLFQLNCNSVNILKLLHVRLYFCSVYVYYSL